MNKQKQAPGLIEDLGAIAGLYRTVFHVMSQRLQHGPHWEERLAEDTFRFRQTPDPPRHTPRPRSN